MTPGVVVDIAGTKYGTSRKAGSVSLLLSGTPTEGAPDVLFVREPLQRLASAWAFFRRDFTGPDLHTFIDRVLSGWIDPHWMPQSQVWSSWGRLVKFERFGEFVSRHEHKTDKPFITYRADELRALYAADSEMYERAA